MRKLGVSVTLLAAGDIFPNLEKGVIDGTEFSMPSIDKAMGFQKIAKNCYFPGWHQPSSRAELIINKRVRDDLPKHNQAQIECACKANIAWERSEARRGGKEGASTGRSRGSTYN